MSNADRHITSKIDPTKLMADTANMRDTVKSLVDNTPALNPTGHYKANSVDNKAENTILKVMLYSEPFPDPSFHKDGINVGEPETTRIYCS